MVLHIHFMCQNILCLDMGMYDVTPIADAATKSVTYNSSQ